MSVPEQVRKAGERANQLHRETYGDGNLADQKPGTPGSEGEGKPVVPAPQPKAESQPEPTPKPSDDDKGAGYWKDRFSVLQGKYNAEVPRLQRRVRDLEIRNTQLEEQLKASEKPGTTDNLPNGELFTEEEREEYGELLPVIERVANRIAQNAAQGAVKPVQETLRERQEDQQAAVEEKYWQRLYELVGTERDDPAKINDDPGFQAYLAETDPFTGRMRDELLKEAHAARDAKRVSAFFNEWLRSQGAGSPPDTNTPDIPPDGRPGAGSGGDGDVTGQVWTRAEISKFYKDAAHGVYRGREDEKARIEQDIMAAQREGRIKH